MAPSWKWALLATGYDRNLLLLVLEVRAARALGPRWAVSLGLNGGGAMDTADRSFAPSPSAPAGQELNAALVGVQVGVGYRF